MEGNTHSVLGSYGFTKRGGERGVLQEFVATVPEKVNLPFVVDVSSDLSGGQLVLILPCHDLVLISNAGQSYSM